MNPIALSDVACWGDKDVAHRIAGELIGLDGVELTPFRAFDEGDVDSGTLAFHGSPLVTRRSLFTRLRYGPKQERVLALLWQAIIGPLFGNPGLELAKKYRIPIILHHENILELAEAGQLERLSGAKVVIENSNFFAHPLVNGDLLGSFSRAVKSAIFVLKDVGLAIDLEHLSQYRWPEGPSLQDFCRLAQSLAPIAEFHICDSGPGVCWQGHLVPGRGVMPLGEQLAFIGAEYPKAMIVLEHSPTISMRKFFPLSTEDRYRAVLDDACEALSYVQNALHST